LSEPENGRVASTGIECVCVCVLLCVVPRASERARAVLDGQGQITQSALTAAARSRIDCITSVNEDRCGIQNAAKEPGPCLSHLACTPASRNAHNSHTGRLFCF
jgi:hypothetical protein